MVADGKQPGGARKVRLGANEVISILVQPHGRFPVLKESRKVRICGCADAITDENTPEHAKILASVAVDENGMVCVRVL